MFVLVTNALIVAVVCGIAWYRFGSPKGRKLGTYRDGGDALAARLNFEHASLGKLHGRVDGFNVALTIDFETSRIQVAIDGLPVLKGPRGLERIDASTHRLMRRFKRPALDVSVRDGTFRATFVTDSEYLGVEANIRHAIAVAKRLKAPSFPPPAKLYERAMRGPDEAARREAYALLAAEFPHTRWARRALREAFSDASREVRLAACVFALASEAPGLRARREKALTEFSSQATVELLNALASSCPWPFLRERAVVALGEFGDLSSFEAIRQFIRDNLDGEPRAAADNAYARIQQRVGPVGGGAVALAPAPIDEGAVSVATSGDLSLARRERS